MNSTSLSGSPAGSLVIISAPSGAGKTTLVKSALDSNPDLKLSVSCTTRAPRQGEVDGREYHFITPEAFNKRRDAGEFLECAHVHGNDYGTSRRWLTEQLEQGFDTLLEIDWQGARQVRAAFPEAVSVFVLPPSFEDLARRLIGRGTDPEAVISRRLEAARGEMRHVDEFAYAIINDDLPSAIKELLTIIAAARLRKANQQRRHPGYFASLIQD